MSQVPLRFAPETTRPGVALLGGTFDPPHRAHLMLARTALEGLRLDRVWLLPAARNPLKPDSPGASTELRAALVAAAVQDEPGLGWLDWDLARPGPSYAIDTARRFAETWPEHRRYWILGADALASLPQWREVGSLVHALDFAVFARPGHPLQVPELPGLRLHCIPAPELEISSSALRTRLAAGLPVDNAVPAGVHTLLEQHQPYHPRTHE